MTDPLPADELERRWSRTLGQGADWERVDPEVTQKPVEVGGTLSALATVGQTLSGGATLGGGTLSGGRTIGGTISGGATVGAGGTASGSAIGAAGDAGYELTGEVGRGGMGVVYRARQRSLARDIALKFVRPEQANQGARERFVSEALVNGLLDHPNIVPVHDLGTTASGEVYLAMKLVGGRSWKALLHPHSPEERAAAAGYDLGKHLAVLQGVGNAIAFAHARGIVHRDLKPENVMVGEFGEVLVMDWGIAVDIRDTPDGDQRAQHKSTVTAPSGTPSYMAPELAEGRGKDIGPWTDVYLLGAILHEVMTGQAPHRGRTLMEVLVAASRSAPPSYGPEVPAGLGAVAAKAMSRTPAERYPGVAAFQAAIAQWLTTRESEKISQAARERLAEAESMSASDTAARNRRYGAFAEAVAGFRQALVLWDGNADARSGERLARVDYAKAALAGGDLGLAEAQLEPLAGEPSARALADQVAAARRDADARVRAATRNRWLLGGAAAAIIAGLAIGFALVNAERAETAREREAAKAAAARAEEQKGIAERNAGEAEQARAKADEQRQLAEKARADAAGRLVSSLRQRANDDRNNLAMLWDAEGLRAAIGQPQAELLQRRRLGARLQQMPTPTLLRHLDGGMQEVFDGDHARSADGRFGLIRRYGEWPQTTQQLIDFDTLEPVGPPLEARFGTDDPLTWSVMPDGSALIKGEKRGELHDIRTGKPLGRTVSLERLDLTVDRTPAEGIRVRYSLGDGWREAALSGVKRVDFDAHSPDQTQVVACGADRRVALWRLPGPEPLGTFEASGMVDNVAWSPAFLLVCSAQGELHLVDRTSGEVLSRTWAPLREGFSMDRCLLIGDDGRMAAVLSSQDDISLLSIVRFPPAGADAEAELLVHAATVPDGLQWIRRRGETLRLICSPETFGDGGRENRNLIVLDWALPSAPVLATVVPKPQAVTASVDGSVVIAVAEGRVHRLRGHDRAPIGAPVAHPPGKVLAVAVSADGGRYALYRDGQVTVHRVADGEPVGTPWTTGVVPKDDETALGHTLTLSRDGAVVMLHDLAAAALWWDVARGVGGQQACYGAEATTDFIFTDARTIARPWLPEDRPVALAVPEKHVSWLVDVSRDGRLMLTVTGMKQDGNYARLWDTATGKPASPELRYQMYPVDGSFSPDGKLFAVSVMDDAIRVYRTATSEPASPPMRTESAEIRFSADGSLLLGYGRNTSYCFDVASTEKLALPETGEEGNGVPCLLPDGSLLRTDGVIAPIAMATATPDQLSARAVLLCGSLVDSTGAPQRLLPADWAQAWSAHEKAYGTPATNGR